MALDVHHVAAPPSPCPGVARALELLDAVARARLAAAAFVASNGGLVDEDHDTVVALAITEAQLDSYDEARGCLRRWTTVDPRGRPEEPRHHGQRNPRWREALDALNRKMGRDRAPLAGGDS